MKFGDTVDGSEIPFPTTWDVKKTLLNNGIIYHIDWCGISSINSIEKLLNMLGH